MVFTSPSWVPRLPMDPPDSITVADFMFNEQYGRAPTQDSLPPFTCGLSGKEYSAAELQQRVEHLASGLAKEFAWEANKGTEWDKVVGIFSLNTVSWTDEACPLSGWLETRDLT